MATNLITRDMVDLAGQQDKSDLPALQGEPLTPDHGTQLSAGVAGSASSFANAKENEEQDNRFDDHAANFDVQGELIEGEFEKVDDETGAAIQASVNSTKQLSTAISANLDDLDDGNEERNQELLTAMSGQNQNLVRIQGTLSDISRLLSNDINGPDIETYKRKDSFNTADFKTLAEEKAEREGPNGPNNGDDSNFLASIGAAGAGLFGYDKLKKARAGTPPVDGKTPHVDGKTPPAAKKGFFGTVLDKVKGTVTGKSGKVSKGKAGLLVGAAGLFGYGAYNAATGMAQKAQKGIEENRSKYTEEIYEQSNRAQQGMAPLEGKELIDFRASITVRNGMIPDPRTGYSLTGLQTKAVQAGLYDPAEVTKIDNTVLYKELSAEGVQLGASDESEVANNPGVSRNAMVGDSSPFGSAAMAATGVATGAYALASNRPAAVGPSAAGVADDIPTKGPVSARIASAGQQLEKLTAALKDNKASKAIRESKLYQSTKSVTGTAANIAKTGVNAVSPSVLRGVEKARTGVQAAASKVVTPKPVSAAPSAATAGSSKFSKAIPILGTALTAYEAANIIFDEKATTGEKAGELTDLAAGTAGAALGAKGGAALGAMIGSFIFPGVGTAIGAGLGGLVGGVGGFLFGDAASETVREAVFDDDEESVVGDATPVYQTNPVTGEQEEVEYDQNGVALPPVIDIMALRDQSQQMNPITSAAMANSLESKEEQEKTAAVQDAIIGPDASVDGVTPLATTVSEMKGEDIEDAVKTPEQKALAVNVPLLSPVSNTIGAVTGSISSESNNDSTVGSGASAFSSISPLLSIASMVAETGFSTEPSAVNSVSKIGTAAGVSAAAPIEDDSPSGLSTMLSVLGGAASVLPNASTVGNAGLSALDFLLPDASTIGSVAGSAYDMLPDASTVASAASSLYDMLPDSSTIMDSVVGGVSALGASSPMQMAGDFIDDGINAVDNFNPMDKLFDFASNAIGLGESNITVGSMQARPSNGKGPVDYGPYIPPEGREPVGSSSFADIASAITSGSPLAAMSDVLGSVVSTVTELTGPITDIFNSDGDSESNITNIAALNSAPSAGTFAAGADIQSLSTAPEKVIRQAYESVKSVMMTESNSVKKEKPRYATPAQGKPLPGSGGTAPTSSSLHPRIDDMASIQLDFGLMYLNSGFI